MPLYFLDEPDASPVRYDDALDQIAERDPNAGETQPTDSAYAAHKRWAIETYGLATWNQYTRGGWGNVGLDIV